MATRILPAEHGALPATLQTFLARIGKTGVPPLSLFLTLGQSARAWAKFSAGSLLDEDSPLSLRERELVINRTCALTRCEYEWGVHVWMFAAAAGLSRGDVAGTLERPIDPSRWSDAEQALLETVDALHDRSTLSDDQFDRLKTYFEPAQVFEIFQLCGFYHQIAFIANGLGLPLEPAGARFEEYWQEGPRSPHSQDAAVEDELAS
jgi:alkylhydroperoxidase family enzyme